MLRGQIIFMTVSPYLDIEIEFELTLLTYKVFSCNDVRSKFLGVRLLAVQSNTRQNIPRFLKNMKLCFIKYRSILQFEILCEQDPSPIIPSGDQTLTNYSLR